MFGGSKRMHGRGLLTVVPAVLAGLALAGCVASARNLGPQELADSHIIFNPYWNTPVVAGADRERWPIAPALDGTGSEIRFRETVIDRQGQTARDRDYYYRRVETSRVRQSGK